MWSTVSMAKTKKSNYAQINIVNVRKALFKNKSNYGCNDALVDNRYIYLFRRTKELVFRASGSMNSLSKRHRWIFHENGPRKIDMKISIKWSFSQFRSALIALEKSASCFDCLLDRKTRNYVLTSWYFLKMLFECIFYSFFYWNPYTCTCIKISRWTTAAYKSFLL